MIISELIAALKEVQSVQGDCQILLDTLGGENYYKDFEVVGKYYTSNYYGDDGKPFNNCFIVFYDD